MERRDFFISYTQRDKAWAVWIAHVLQGNGYTLYMQEMDILPGDSFLTKMNYFLENSGNFISIWSKSYNNSYYGMMELEAAVTAKMRIIFCCVDNYPVLKLYRRLVHVALPDMSAASEEELTNAVQSVVQPSVPKIKTTPTKPAWTHVWKGVVGFFLAVAIFFVVVQYIKLPITEEEQAIEPQEDVYQERTGEELFMLGEYHRLYDISPAKMLDYYEQAVAKGNVNALIRLGEFYEYGVNDYSVNLKPDYPKAADYYEQAAEKDNVDARISSLLSLSRIYKDYLGDDAKAGMYYEQAENENRAHEMYGNGVLYEFVADYANARNCYEQALGYYQKAFAAGSTKASVEITKLHEKLNIINEQISQITQARDSKAMTFSKGIRFRAH